MQQAPKHSEAVDLAKITVIEHLLVRDRDTKQALVNKRGNPGNISGGENTSDGQ